ncbi:MAG: acyl--CoA ligase [Planctomycetota bacterium]|nr:acyl--CoA ligase [Planctomycetota bacterium]
MRLRLLEQLRKHAHIRAEAPALVAVASELSWNWAQVWLACGRTAARVRQHVAPGRTVILCASNSPEFVVAFAGILLAGCKVFPLTPECAGPELLAAARGCDAGGFIGSKDAAAILGAIWSMELDQVPLTRDIRNPMEADEMLDADDSSRVAMLLNSSGSTGGPKIVHRDTRALNAVADACVGAVGFEPMDQVLAAVPLCHSFGVEHGLLAPLSAGSCVHLCEAFEAGVVLKSLFGGVTIFPVVPFMAEALSRASETIARPSALRQVYSAGAPLAENVARAFAAQFGIQVGQVYGATEIGSVTFGDPISPNFNPASVGRAMAGVSIRISRAGEVEVKADSMFDRYLADEAGTSRITADGYFLTGDLGFLDSFGNLSIAGRLKLLIDVGGQKVNPLEVEKVLAEHPAVAECVVLPMPVSPTVTRLKAVVTARAGLEVTPEMLRSFAKERLSAFKVPRVIEIRNTLPRSSAGKVIRRLIES